MAAEKDLSATLGDKMTLEDKAELADAADDFVDNVLNMSKQNDPTKQSVDLPPSKQKSADELLAEMKKIPLFMTNLDDIDPENEQLEALRAIAYEGTRAEIADNFRDQGNDCVKTKQWLNAREFYTKALQALKGPQQPQDPEEGPSDVRVVEIDEEAEEQKERRIEEACYANRALCNLEMKNYGSCQRDCAGALKFNPRNVKAWYRAASACLALDKVSEALDACEGGLKYESANAALRTLREKIEKRQVHLTELERVRRERVDHEKREAVALKLALKIRNILTRETANPPNMEDATISLSSPTDPKSTLSFPVILLYPFKAQSDFVKSFAEDENIAQHLQYILPTPWDEDGEYIPQDVDCYMETAAGGLIKAGKNLPLVKLLGSGKVEVVNGLVKVNMVPKTKAAQWIEEFKQRRGKAP